MKKTSQFYFLLLFSVSLFLFPIFFTQAKPITITPCTPASAVGSNQTQKCIIDQTVVPTVVKLNWNIAKQFTKPACMLSCGIQSANQCAQTAFFYKDKNDLTKVVPPRRGGVSPDGVSCVSGGYNTYPIPTDQMRFLRPIDEIYITPTTGDTCQVVCRELQTNPKTPISAILANFETATKLPSSPEAEIKSQKWQMVAGENGLPCEWPFGGTASIGGNGGVVYGTVGASGNGSYDNLEKGLPAVITEENFSDWSSEDILDNTVKSNGWGSGDMEDLEAEMNKIQKNQRIFHANPTDYTQWYYDHLNYDTIVPVLKKALDDYTPTIIGISWSTSAHAMLALKYIDQGNGDFALKVLDPNTHNLAYVDCSKSAKGPMFPGIGFLYTVKCSFYLDGKLKNGEMFNSLNGVPDIDCSSKSSRVRPEPTEWLLKGATNWPSFVNPNFPNSPDGNCFGWSYVTRLVACFGDFAGYDFHSGDSYTVGAGCDANHYPNMDYINSHPSLLIQKSAKSAWLNSANWLGNVLTPLLKLWPMKRMF